MCGAYVCGACVWCVVTVWCCVVCCVLVVFVSVLCILVCRCQMSTCIMPHLFPILKEKNMAVCVWCLCVLNVVQILNLISTSCFFITFVLP